MFFFFFVVVIRCLYSAVSLTLVREQRLKRIIFYIIIINVTLGLRVTENKTFRFIMNNKVFLKFGFSSNVHGQCISCLQHWGTNLFFVHFAGQTNATEKTRRL